MPSPRGTSTARVRNAAVCLLLLVVLPVLVFPETLQGRTFLFSDVVLGFYTYRTLMWQMAQAGHMFFWNPYLFSGQPLAGCVQAGIFYPGNLPAYLVEPDVALSLYVMGHLALGSVFMWLYLRTLGHRPVVAVVGAVCFAYSGCLIAHIGRPNTVGAAVWVAGLLWSCERYAADGRLRWIGLSSLFVGLQFLAGMPQTSLYMMTLYAVYVVVRPVWAPLPGEGRWRAGARWLLTMLVVPVALGFLLAAIALFPFLEIAGYSPRHLIGTAFASFLFPHASWFYPGLLFPHLHPDMATDPVTEEIVYFGLLPVVLALCAWLQPRRRVVVLWAIAGVFMVLSFGDLGGPVIGWIDQHIPIFNKFRLPMRMMLITSTCLAILAADGLTALLERLREPRARRVAAALLSILAVAELGYHAHNHVILVHDTFYRHRPAAFASLEGQVPTPRYLSTPGTHTRYGELGLRWDASNIVGIDATPIWDYIRYLFWSQIGDEPPREEVARAMTFSYTVPVTRIDNTMIRLLGLRLVLEPHDDEVIGVPTRDPMPRAFLVGRWRVAPRDEHYAILARDGSFDPRHEVLLEQPPGIEPHDTSAGEVRITHYEPDHETLETEAAQPMVLFASEIAFPGWQVAVDGQPAPMLRANAVFRAVALPAGHHVVTFDYRPASVRLGAWTTAGALVAIVALLLVDLRRPTPKT